MSSPFSPALLIFLCVITAKAYNIPNCSDIADCTGCTDDVECFCEHTKNVVRFPCKPSDAHGTRNLETYDATTAHLRCPLTRNGEHVTLEANTAFWIAPKSYCSPKGKKWPHCVCYKSRADLAKSKSCPIKITLVKNDSPETKDLVIVTDAQPEPVVSCSNNSTSEQPPENISAGGTDFFASFLIVLNAIQFAAILILVFLFRYKLKMLNRSSSCAVENVEINDTNVGYEQPRQFAKEPEPIDTEEQPEFIMYEDAQVYLQESAYASSSHHSRMPVKSQSSDTAYGSESCDFGKREDSESSNDIRIGDIHYY